jgi:Protein of unknown function (DUF1569)
MKNLFDTATAREVKERLGRLTPESSREWGTMTAAQTLAHCSVGMETAFGDAKPPRMMMGRILGPVIKKMALGNDEPMRKNSPTAPMLVIKDERDFADEKLRLMTLIERFCESGAKGCTDHPHAFFGVLTPEQWAELMYKHLDHHLRQFGV